jgi:hypothetical protein
MGCGWYRKMLQLNRPGELSAREAEKLARHLGSCPECSAEFKKIQAVDRMVDKLRSRAPVLEHPDAMLEAVLAEIRRPAAVRTSHQQFPGRLVELLLSPAARLGAASLAVFAIGLFMVQEVALLGSISALEEKVGGQRSRPPGPGIEYSISAPTAGWNADIHQLRKLVVTESEGRQNGRVVVSQRTIEQFVSGMGPGPVETLWLASTLGSDPRHLRSLVQYLEQHAKAHVVF